jgi:uncharacterized protein YabE (DUF348 family)
MEAYLRQHSSLIKLFAMVLVCLVVTTSFVYSAAKKDIIISDIDGIKNISTYKDTVEEVLRENNIQLAQFDKIDKELNKELEDGLQICITRARKITVQTSDLGRFFYTTAADLKTALEEAEVYVGQLDRVEPSVDTAIASDLTVTIKRVEEQVVEETVDVEFENKVVKSDELDVGTVRVVQKGQQGQKQLSVKITYEDGKEVDRQVIGEKILKQAINGLREEGTKTTLVTSRGKTYNFVKSITMSATAYDSSFESCGKHEGDPYYGITASGMKVKPGIVAVDPRVIPLGTWLYVEGYGEALAADTGGAIKGNKIDLFYESPKTVKNFGRRKVKVYVLDKPRYKF